MRYRMVRGYAIAGALALASASLPTTAAWGATTLFACVNGNSGELKMVSAGTTCHQNETLMSWDIAGPAGTPGPVGPPGPAGAPGPAGPPGSTGLTNVQYIEGGMYPGTSVARAFCPDGTKVMGGGGLSLNQKGLQQNFPIADAGGLIAFGSIAVGWQVAAEDFSDVQAHVVCIGP
jgi:hypothetical protein